MFKSSPGTEFEGNPLVTKVLTKAAEPKVYSKVILVELGFTSIPTNFCFVFATSKDQSVNVQRQKRIQRSCCTFTKV